MGNESANAHALHFQNGTGIPGAGAVLKIIQEASGPLFSRQLDPVIELADNIPAFSGNYLEVHFNRGDNWLDFLTRINSQYDRPLLCNKELMGNFFHFAQKEYQLLMNPEKNGFGWGIENLWFEYDLPVQTKPSLFFDLYRRVDFRCEKYFEGINRITGMFGYPLYPEMMDFFCRLKNLHLKTVHYGLMFSRETNLIRLTIPDIGAEKLIDTLEAIGWAGNYDILREIQARYLYQGQRIVLSVDFDSKLGSRLGVEVYETEPEALVKKLYRNRVYSTDYYDVLKNWEGYTLLHPAIAQALQLLHKRPVDRIYKRINHVKFSINNDSVDTKAYLYYCF